MISLADSQPLKTILVSSTTGVLQKDISVTKSMPVWLIYHNHALKSIILKNFKLLQNDLDTGRIFSQPPLISFKRDKNIGNSQDGDRYVTPDAILKLPLHGVCHVISVKSNNNLTLWSSPAFLTIPLD